MLYRFSGDHPRSDNGYWEAIVEATNRGQARRLVEKELQEFSKGYMIENCDILLLPKGSGVIHHTIQTG